MAKCRYVTSQREKHGKKDDSRENEKKGSTQEHILLTPSEELSNNGMYKVGRERIHHLKATVHCITSRTEYAIWHETHTATASHHGRRQQRDTHTLVIWSKLN